MSRPSGSNVFAGTLEPQAGGPLDARAVVATKADLTTSGSFPYSYIGMIVSVQAENKMYMLIGSDPTQLANWKPAGSGHLIQEDGTDMTEREKLNFLDHDVEDNSTDESTDVAPHRLTQEELQDIVSPLPGYQSGMLILSPVEQQVGLYYNPNGNGTKKPLYQKTVTGTTPTAIDSSQNIIDIDSLNTDLVFIVEGIIQDTDATYEVNMAGQATTWFRMPDATTNKDQIAMKLENANRIGKPVTITLRYTKTTDNYE